MIAAFARHPTAGNLLMVLAVVAGLATVVDLRRESMPQTRPDEVEVRVVQPGASALEVEEGICRPLEEVLTGVPFLEELRSDAREGLATVTCRMHEAGDFQAFQGDIQREVDALTTLPSDAEDPTLEALGLEDKVLAIHVTADSSPASLEAYCLDLAQRLRQLPEVSLVEVQGFGSHLLRVELRPEALARLQLTPADVARVLDAQSVDLPVGTLETAARDVLLRFVERRRTPAELLDLVVRAGTGGAEVRLREIARVVDTFDDAWDRIEHEGVRAGRLVVSKTRAEDSLSIADAVRAFVAEEAERVPRGVALHVTEDSSDVLRGQIRLVVTNGWQGMILVALTLWLFFTARLAGWVAMGLPVSILGACFLMPAFGLSVNMLTLIGVLLALGLLMDDAIVIAENVATHRLAGKSGMQAAIDGVREVGVGVLASFGTTVCVLGPLAMISGESGQQLRVIPITLILVMTVSLLEAFFILPGHLGHSLGHAGPEQAGRFRRGFDAGLDFVRERLVGGLVDLSLRHRVLCVSLTVGVLIACAGLVTSGRIPFRAMPDLEGDTIVARVLMPQGTPLDATRQVVRDVVDGLRSVDAEWSQRQPDGRRLVRTWSVRYGENRDAFETGAHVATVSVDLLTAAERAGSIDAYLAAWRDASGALPGAIAVLFTTPSVGAGGKPIEVRFQGPDLDRLAAVADESAAWIRELDGVRNLLSDLRPSKPELSIGMLPGAAGYGVEAEGVARQIATAFQGTTVDELQLGPRAYEVRVGYAPSARAGRADLRDLRIPLADGTQVPLPAVARVHESRGWARIARVDGERTVTLRGDVDYSRGNASEILARFRAELVPVLAERYPDVHASVAGEAADSAQTQRSMTSGMLLGLLGVFLLLSLQFQSYLEPLVVMTAIPLSLIGVILGHWLLDFPFTLPSMLGFVSLAGVVVNDSILLIEFIKLARRTGTSVLAAASQASRSRFRAILLTSSTTVAGLLPLLAETSLQAQLVKGLVISVAFGLMASTVLVLFVVPSLYAIFGDLRLLSSVEAADA